MCLVAACGGVEAPEPDVAYACPIAYCGSNSPTIDHYGFHELNLDGIANKEGFRILGASAGTDFADLAVTGGRIVLSAPNRRVVGSALVGARIYIAHSSGTQFALEITSVQNVAEVVSPNGMLEAYRFQWATIISGALAGPVHAGDVLPLPVFELKQDVCPEEDWDEPGSNEWDEAAGMPDLHALVYEGDRIDPVRRTVAPTIDRRWFNIGCGHDTLVKLRLTRNTMLTANLKWRLVQATMKMLSADYCGTGKAFTRTGEPLVWRNRGGMELKSSATSFEARWNEYGAYCLDVPRAAYTKNPDLAAAFPDIEDAISRECKRPPPCQNATFSQYETGNLVISGNVDR